MSEHTTETADNQAPHQTNLYERVARAFTVEDRDWNTVSRRVATRLLAGGGVALALMASGIAGFRAVYASKIYPNIFIGDVNVGGMTRDEAIAAVQQRVDELNTSTVSYTYESHLWEPTLAELGVSVDVPALVDAALALGRDDKATDRLVFTSELMQETQTIPLSFGMLPFVLDEWLDGVDSDIDDPAIDATFTVSGAQLEITQDYTGIVSDRESVTAQLMTALESLERIAGDLPTTTDYPRITKSDLETNEAAVLAILSNSVTVRFEDARWEIKPEEVSAFMIFTSSVENGQAVTNVDFDRTGMAGFLRDRFTTEVNRMPVNSTVQFYNGALSTTTASIDGKTMKVNEFADLVAASFLGNHERVDVPVVTTRAKVREDNLDTLGINERLCRVDSNFIAGLGTDRAHNVEVGIRLINNVIVAPGDDFSFNGAVGSIEANSDFVGGTGIVNGVIQDEFGGGICQVTTTTFRAAIMAGLPITEWYAHSYRLSGYELDNWGPGFDASILQADWVAPEDWADLKFTNNTEHFILISSWSDNGIHVVEIYGTPDGREVTISETSTWEADPSDENSWTIKDDAAAGTNYISAYPLDGLNASFTRTVSGVPGEEPYERTFTSKYKARGYQCTCSADMYEIPCWQ